MLAQELFCHLNDTHPRGNRFAWEVSLIDDAVGMKRYTEANTFGGDLLLDDMIKVIVEFHRLQRLGMVNRSATRD